MLPFEIRVKIANELSQFDCLNLLRTSKALYESTVPRLYQHVVIDENYSQFNKEISFKRYEKSPHDSRYTPKEHSCTFVKSPHNFRRLLLHYTEIFNSRHRMSAAKDPKTWLRNDRFPHIQTLRCLELPDSLNTYDHELNDQIGAFFSTLGHLRELVWLSDNFRLEYLACLPDPRTLHTIVLNIKFSNYLSELLQAEGTTETSPSTASKLVAFPNVVNFQIRPFQNSARLQRILNSFLGDAVLGRLQVLKLARFDKDVNVLLPPCGELVAANTDTLSEHDLRTIQALSESKLGRLDRLQVLLINNCLVSRRDADLLVRTVNLQNLKVLELKNVSEYQTRLEANADTEDSFLARISPHLSCLEHLALDFREAYTDTVWLFLSHFPSSVLKSLDLVLRYNETKLEAFTVDQLYSAYAEALLCGNTKSTVTKLSIEIKQENQFCDLEIPLPSRQFYREISQFRNLSALRINPDVNHDSHQLIQMLKSLPKLLHLDVFGTQAGGAPNLGLGMVHPTIYDDWFKVQHVAVMYCQNIPGLRYIRINKCVFENATGVVPRDGLDLWFSQLVRVDYTV